MKEISKSSNSNSLAILAMLIMTMTFSLFVTETAFAETRYKIKSLDNLNSIVEQFYQDSELSKSQLMVGILIKNPKAFKGGNINFLLRGKRLILPDESEIQQVSDESANELLSKHARFFRRGRTGNLATPIFVEAANEPSEMLEKQRSQTAKINQLKQESESLKKQLEDLVNAKEDRDKRLFKLEKYLQQARNSDGSEAIQNMPEGLEKTNNLEKTNKELNQSLKETKSKLAENANSNTALERRVEHLQEALKGKNNQQDSLTEVNGDTIQEKSTDNALVSEDEKTSPVLFWLAPLLLLLAGLWYFLVKRKKAETPSHSFDDFEEMLARQKKDAEINGDDNLTEASLETSIKLDVARAYIEAEDTQAAKDILKEIIEEGSDEQQQEAKNLLEKLT